MRLIMRREACDSKGEKPSRDHALWRIEPLEPQQCVFPSSERMEELFSRLYRSRTKTELRVRERVGEPAKHILVEIPTYTDKTKRIPFLVALGKETEERG